MQMVAAGRSSRGKLCQSITGKLGLEMMPGFEVRAGCRWRTGGGLAAEERD